MDNILSFSPVQSLEIREYTVSELSAQIKQSIENEFGYVRVRGEISGLKIAASGHAYFNLKDANAVLAATCWRPTLAKMQAKLDEGLEVIASGKLTAYAGQSRYQISVDHIEPAGAGALMQILAKRKAALQAEGLFDNARKKPLPFFPKIIGVVTSLSGAVISDIVHRISDRCPTGVVIWPVTVQGDKAADEIAAAIDGLQTLANKPDVIIVARGGGSIEDLWAFNEEVVVRAVARCEIPIISAIGHETDFTLTDFAADVRAPTPTAAAEFATPVAADLQATITALFTRIASLVKAKTERGREIVRAYDRVLANPMVFVLRHEQRLDDLAMRMQSNLPKLFHLREMQLKQYRLDFLDPSKLLPLKISQVENLATALARSSANILQNLEAKLTIQTELLRALDYNNVLGRGFAIVRSGDEILDSIERAKPGDMVNIELKDGKLDAKIV
jgi:exodeoxyribonuclease VII large subunit